MATELPSITYQRRKSFRPSMDAVIDANVELVKYCYSMNQWYIDTVAKAPK
jgi:hypothetical protein